MVAAFFASWFTLCFDLTQAEPTSELTPTLWPPSAPP